MTSLTIHQCEFVKWIPSAVESLAFSPDGMLMALGRANSRLEIWDVSKGFNNYLDWHLRTVLGGDPPGGCCKSLVFTPTNHLLSAGLNGCVYHWDLTTLEAEEITTSDAGSIWALDANGEHILLACEDGTVRQFDHRDRKPLACKKKFHGTPQKRMLTCKFGHNNTVVGGGMDGALHIWDAHTCQSLHTIPVDTLRAARPAFVWDLLPLSSGTLVSADSLGNVQFWDTRTGSLIQSFKENVADVLALAVDVTETKLFASGVDNKLNLFEYDKEADSWHHCCGIRKHSHDITCLRIAPLGNILVSGSIDTTCALYSVNNFSFALPLRRLSPFPHTASPPCAVALRTQLLLCHTGPSVAQVFHLGATAYHLLVEIRLSDHDHIVSLQISPDGEFILLATQLGLYVYRCSLHDSKLEVKKIATYGSSTLRNLLFLPHNRFIASSGPSVQVFALDNDCVTLIHDFTPQASHQPMAAIVSLALSPNCELLASGDTSNTVHIFNLRTLTYFSTLPQSQNIFKNMVFRTPTELVILFSTKDIMIWNVLNNQLTDWSRKHAAQLPLHFVNHRDTISGLRVHPTNPNSLFFYSESSLFHLNLSLYSHSSSKPNFEEIKKYEPLLFADFIAENSLVIVKRSWIKIIQNFPNSIDIHKYGT